MELFQPQFPSTVSGRSISFLKIVRIGEVCAVTKVTHHKNQTLKVIAGCRIGFDLRGKQIFITHPDDVGHLDLCKLLSSKGINGGYLTWLFAVDDGDDVKAEQNRSSSTISFEISLMNERYTKEWTLL